MMGESVSVDGTEVAAASMDGVGVLDGATYAAANDALAAIHGYDTPDELVGRAWADLYTPAEQAVTAGSLLTRVREAGEWRGRVLGHRRNGDGVPVTVSLRAAADGVVCVVRERPEATNSEGPQRRTDDRAHGRVQDALGPVGLSETLLDALDDVLYIVDETNDVVGWNQRLNDRLGYTDDDLAEMRLGDFLPEEYGDLLGDDGVRMVDLPDRIREMDVVAKDGERIPFELRGVTYTDEETGERYRVGIARDITERKARERELERYETIVETVDDGVYVLDEDLRVELANERFFELLARFGFSRDEVRALHAHELVVDEEERAALEAEIQRAIERDSHIGSFEMSAEPPDGERIVCESRFRLSPGPDGEHRGCIGILRDITERKERERQLTRQRDELDTLNRINELLLAVARDLFESPMYGEIEATVCARLAASDLYQFAWIGTPEAGGSRLVPRASAGIDDDYLDSVTVTTDEHATGQGPGGRAFRTGTIQVSQDIATDPTFEPWRAAALERDVRSAAAVPLLYDGTAYGILAVYASRPLAFSSREQRGFEILGEAIGYALNATRTRRLLYTEDVVELELGVTDRSEFAIAAAARLDDALTLEGYVSTADDAWLLYFSLAGPHGDRFVETARDEAAVETARLLDAGGTRQLVALTVRSSLLDSIAALGGRVTDGTVDDGRGTFVVEIPQSTDVREFIEQVRSTRPGVELLAKRDHEQPAGRPTQSVALDPVDLTDRQRQALTAAYHGGYFAWPRENTAAEIAELLAVSRPTFQAHLRKAERALLDHFFDGVQTRAEP